MYRVWNLLEKNSQFLLVGAVTALIWANVSPGSYHALVDFPLLEDGLIGHLSVDADGHAHRTVTLHYLINDVLMALFFAVAGKEVWEAVALRGVPCVAGRQLRR